MLIRTTFNIWRYWFKKDTPKEVLDTLNYRILARNLGPYQPYVDVNFYGKTDKNITMMELRYQEWIEDREFITYDVEGDDGL